MNKRFNIFLIFISVLFFGCQQKESTNLKNFKIAFLADVHLQDIFGNYSDTSYKGLKNPENGDFVNIRTMQSQLHSTRLFNENYFAFIAALDDIAKRNVKYVILPGDFSDDGQPVNIRGLNTILKSYEANYGITFLLTTGNHDPVRPFSYESGKKDFLGEGGKRQPIMSAERLYTSNLEKDHKTVISPDIKKLGYQEIVTMLGDFGFFPKKNYTYWETPFSTYTLENYSLEKALNEADLDKRNYKLDSTLIELPDVSYLVEPVEGLWLLAIDANVYVPTKKTSKNKNDAASFSGASIGYNNVLTHKKHLISWVEKVVEQANKENKTLIAFSHYPMIDFNDNATSNIEKLLGENKMQVHRVPSEQVSEIFANAGIKIHFGGHMHINDTGIRTTKKGNSMVNVQIPSLAAYIPAYKLVTLKNKRLEVETIVLKEVARFNELFKLYQQEYDFLKVNNVNNCWDIEILSANNYHEFTNAHLKQLVQKRFLPNDWPEEFKQFMLVKSGSDFLKIVNTNIPKSINVIEFEKWNGFDFIFDLYRLRSADKLAISDIGIKRIEQYQYIIDGFIKKYATIASPSENEQKFQQFCIIFNKFLNGAPADKFIVNLKNGSIQAIEY